MFTSSTKAILFILLSAVLLVADQGLNLGANATVTNISVSLPETDYRLEVMLYSWTIGASGSTSIMQTNTMNMRYTAAGELQCYFSTDSGGSTPTISLAGRTQIVIRCQREYATKKTTLEIWNLDGSGYAVTTATNTTAGATTINRFQVGYYATGQSTNQWIGSYGFVRLYNGIVPAGGYPSACRTSNRGADRVGVQRESAGFLG